jgi:hypothetical protein
MPEILEQSLFDNNRHPDGKFEFFRDFFNAEQAEGFVALLKSNDIPYKLEKTRTLLSGSIAGHGLVPYAIVKLRALDFSKVNKLLGDAVQNDEAYISNHYFQAYKAAELLEVVQKPDEWTAEDLAVARYLLAKQGVSIPDKQVEDFKQQRNEILREGKAASAAWVVFGFLSCIVGALLLSPFFIVGALGLGLYFWKDTALDADGNKYFVFDEKSRKLGKVIFYLGWVLLFLSVLLFFIKPYKVQLF